MGRLHRAVLSGAAAAALLLGITGAAHSSYPNFVQLSTVSPSATWEGNTTLPIAPLGCIEEPIEPSCDTLYVEVIDAGEVTVSIDAADTDNMDLIIKDAAGAVVAESATDSGDEALSFAAAANSQYRVLVKPTDAAELANYTGAISLEVPVVEEAPPAE